MNAYLKIGAADLKIQNIPQELKVVDAWNVWREETRTDNHGETKPTKVPISARTGHPASVTNAANSVSLAAALQAMERLNASGIGFVFHEGHPYVGIDFDGCIDADGALDGEIAGMVADIPAYWEVSPSGRGLKGFAYAPGLKLGGRNVKDFPREGLGAEVYTDARFFTVTGHVHHLSHTLGGAL